MAPSLLQTCQSPNSYAAQYAQVVRERKRSKDKKHSGRTRLTPRDSLRKEMVVLSCSTSRLADSSAEDATSGGLGIRTNHSLAEQVQCSSSQPCGCRRRGRGTAGKRTAAPVQGTPHVTWRQHHIESREDPSSLPSSAAANSAIMQLNGATLSSCAGQSGSEVIVHDRKFATWHRRLAFM